MVLLKKHHILTTYFDIMKSTGGLSGIRDENSINYSIDSINAIVFGEELYPTLEEKASRLCFNLVMNHPFIDGNKRIGYYCLTATLELNGFVLDLSERQIIDTILNLASHKIDYEEFLEIVRKNIKPVL